MEYLIYFVFIVALCIAMLIVYFLRMILHVLMDINATVKEWNMEDWRRHNP